MSSVGQASIPAGKWTPELALVIEEKLQATWSPEQIMERLRQEGQAMKTPMACPQRDGFRPDYR
ncbi:transposase and inactivated derivative [Paenibacillus popilliae ATCC 14706]|uniref:Transposase and inactivated derivative n=1 Tax=Paenibacillus popilliae ATCC 14706 TaxID=1212764 RepID=M9LJV1_PAEPP|nr:transposase and inactivated derivative [Paenibacillus popilliae ATCC 14706]